LDIAPLNNTVMKNSLVILILLFTGFIGYTQSFEVGTAEYTFTDSERNRSIPAIIYYPSSATGRNVPVASSQFGFPVVAFGHGFVIEPEAYSWLGEFLAAEGYILVLPATEGQLLPPPDHLNFGRDIRFCAEEVIRLSGLQGNPLSGKVLPRYAMMGHSMGGGATYLGAAESAEVITTITFAAADTDPSSIAAASNIGVPSLVFAAEEDCVTPVSANQIPMYENLPNGEKAFVNIKNASHCNFTDGSASLCYLGETFPCFGSGPFIPRSEQHSRVLAVLLPWLDQYLRSNCTRGELFLSELEAGSLDGRWTSQIDGEELYSCAENCAIPQNIVVSQETAGFALSWSSVEDALGYQVQARLEGVQVEAANSFNPFFLVSQLDNSLNYQFRVRSFCPEQGLGSFSDWSGAAVVSLSLFKSSDLFLRYTYAWPGSIISIQTMNGEIIMEKYAAESEGELNISFLPKGLFLARIMTSRDVKVLKFSVM
jgi:pimeloyl-ACP methyl ester carboxylesterase